MKQPSMLTAEVIRVALIYIVRGILRIKRGHIPPSDHDIPNDFLGVCVASNANPATDDYVLTQIRQLGIYQVRIDFTYGDFDNHNTRFLQRLLDDGLQVHLHLVQPFSAACSMENIDTQNEWRSFLQKTLEQFGSKVTRIEIGSTINRKRWAGYSMPGFLAAWEIAHAAIKSRNLILAGPSVTDFEPVYNMALLKHFQDKNQLPDIHTDNLFSERVSEPERFDHRILKYRWATLFKYNLIKKARLLKKICQQFNVQTLMSPAAFWAIYRIQRLLPDGEQKQADYAARYILLCAASGALRHVYWGALICHREGLIDDGLQDTDYPALERITHYQSADGDLKNYHHQPSFDAFRQAGRIVQGAHYIAPMATANGLEIHSFNNNDQLIHAIWTINGKTVFLDDLYEDIDLKCAQYIDRDGNHLSEKPNLASESPLYLIWPASHTVNPKTNLHLATDLAIHQHIPNQNYYTFDQDGWRGLILAKNTNEAKQLLASLHPDQIQAPQKQHALRHARNAIWTVPDPRNHNKNLTIKQPVRMYPHKQFLDRFKPSKAKRSWNGAVELLRRGINTATPVAFFEKINDSSLKQNFYICEYIKADCTIAEVFTYFAKGEKTFAGFSDETVYAQLAEYLRKMHQRGSYFRDLSGGNVLVNFLPDNKLHFSLIDTGRAHFFNHYTPFNKAIADMTRICNKLHWSGRERLMGYYLGVQGKQWSFKNKLPFYIYDSKIWLKRRIGRKGIKKLIQTFNSTN